MDEAIIVILLIRMKTCLIIEVIVRHLLNTIVGNDTPCVLDIDWKCTATTPYTVHCVTNCTP